MYPPEETSAAQTVNGATAAAPAPHSARSGTHAVLAGIARRWPLWLAIAVAAAIWGGPARGLGELLLLLPLLYLVMAVIGHRRGSWPVLVVLVAGFVALEQQEWVGPSTALLAAAALVLVAGAVRWPRLPSRSMFLIQVAGMVAFSAVALVALAVAPDVGRYVIAAGWFAHGLWDFAHLRANRVVSRSYAEWCGVLDVLVAASLIFPP